MRLTIIGHHRSKIHSTPLTQSLKNKLNCGNSYALRKLVEVDDIFQLKLVHKRVHAR